MVVMTEAEQPGTSSPTVEPPSRSESRGSRSPSEAEPGVLGGQRRRGGRPPADLQLCLDPQAEPPERSQRKAASIRVKPVEDLSPMLSLSDFETKLERKKPQSSQISKSNSQYHKLFKEVNRDELLRQSYTCALQRDILYQGKMFVSENWICFHSRVFGRDTKISIPVTSVTFLKKTKTALLVPNALVIETSLDQHVFVSFLSRNTTFKLLKSLCLHLEVDKTCISPVTSCENSFRVSGPPSLPLELCRDFSGLDGVVQQRRKDMMESSSSGSQTPDSDKITDFGGLPEAFLNPVKGSGELSVHADVHLQTAGQKHGVVLNNNGPVRAAPGVPGKEKWSQTVSLQALLLLYLLLVSVLVLSSCFMAFKIVSLEQRLNSLLSTGGNIRSENLGGQRPPDDVSAEIYGELSTNLFKLEKIQRNLRKLLEET